jgi:hypothetical protein
MQSLKQIIRASKYKVHIKRKDEYYTHMPFSFKVIAK